MTLLLADTPTASVNTEQAWVLGPAGITAKPTWSAILDLVLSTSGGVKPTPSIHMPILPCMKLVWHSFQLKPTTPGGAQSRMMAW